jgi:U32 family peptidase
MKIIAPIASLNEVDMLLHFGADELYCGLKTREWENCFGKQWWMNRRSPDIANIASLGELKEITEKAHEKGARVHIAMNTAFYSTSGICYVLKLCQKLVEEADIDGLIVSDLNLLIQLSEEKLPVRIHLSSLGSCFNSESVEFYRSLGVKRIILPRQLRLSEIKLLIKKSHPEMEFEVFALNDGCFYEEGFCQTSHSLGAFCLTDWDVGVYQPGKGKLSPNELKNHKDNYREYLWYQNNCGSSFQQDGLPNGPCSLCWFGHFRDWGVTAVKIVGREAAFIRKMGSLQLVKAVVDKVGEKAFAEEIGTFARSLRNTPEYCKKGYMCYFRECA